MEDRTIQTDDEYFELIYRETFAELSRFALFRAPSLADAEDVVAAVFLAFYQSVVLKSRRPSDPRAYLFKMARHELGRWYRARIPTMALDDSQSGLAETLPADINLEDDVFDRLTTDEIWAAVCRLSDAEQIVLVAHLRLDMTFAQIAGELHQGESAVKLRYHRSLKKLRKMLEPM